MESWKRNLYILWGTQFFAMVGMNLVVPFLPFYIRDLGVANPNELARWSGLVFAGPFFTSFIATPVWGSMGDRHGQKLMVVRAIFGLGISQILIGFSQDVYQLFLFRMLQGAISGFIASALALVSTSTPKERMGYALGLLQSATAGGGMIGPAIGGFLADTIGYREIFFLVAAVCFGGGFIIMRFVNEAPHVRTDGSKTSIPANFRLMFTDRQLRVIGITIVLSQAAAMMIEPIFALFIEQFKASTSYLSTVTGVIFSITGVFMVIGAPWWGNRNDRLGYRRNLTYALAGTGIAYGLHMVVPGLILLGILRAGLGFVRGGILHALYSMTSLRAPENRRSGMIGIASSLTTMGNLIGPIAGGMVAGNFGIRSVFGFNSVLFLIGSLVVWRYIAEVHQHATANKGVEVARALE
jgi:DHA1 family multidrug resistance protein-like MFS transporter